MRTTRTKFIFLLVITLVGISWHQGTYRAYEQSRLIQSRIDELAHTKSLRDIELVMAGVRADIPLLSAGSEEAITNIVSITSRRIREIDREHGVESDMRSREAIAAAGGSMRRMLEEQGRNKPSARFYYEWGELYRIVWIGTGKSEHALLAEEQYAVCLEKSPRRPECLLGLFELYIQGRDWEQARRIGEEILMYWPASHDVRKVIEILKKTQSMSGNPFS